MILLVKVHFTALLTSMTEALCNSNRRIFSVCCEFDMTISITESD